jgi:hypothetical protein
MTQAVTIRRHPRAFELVEGSEWPRAMRPTAATPRLGVGELTE